MSQRLIGFVLIVPSRWLLTGALLLSAAPGQETPPNPPTTPAPAPAGAADQQQAAQKPTAKLPLAVGRPAPDVAFDEWLGAKQGPTTTGKVVKVGDGESPAGVPDIGAQLEKALQQGVAEMDKLLKAHGKSPGELAAYHQQVVLVHRIDWTEPSRGEDLVELVREVLRANADRGVRAIGMMDQDPAASQRAHDDGIDWPVALVTEAAAASPYLHGARSASMFLVGRSGQLAWLGEPTMSRGEFEKALSAALNEVAAERIERDLGKPFDSVLADYYAGATAKAIAAAERLQGAPETDEVLRQDARYLVAKAGETELRWLRTMRETSTRRREFDTYVQLIDALVDAFPKSSGKQAQAHERELAKQGDNGPRLKSERKLLELQRQRPALFPSTHNRAHDAFEKKLLQFLADKRLTKEPQQRAQDLVDRYRSTAR